MHTVYVPADRLEAGLPAAVRAGGALAAVEAHGPLPFADASTERVLAKLAREPIEDLRIDFEDGYGVRADDEEDAAAAAAAGAVVRDGAGRAVRRAAVQVPGGGDPAAGGAHARPVPRGARATAGRASSSRCPR